MNPSLRSTLLVFVDVTLGVLILCVLPFAWILKDGLGPDMVPAKGIRAIWNFLMTFYVGPAILLFGSFDLLLRRAGPSSRSSSGAGSAVTWVAALVAFSALSLVFVQILFRP